MLEIGPRASSSAQVDLNGFLDVLKSLIRQPSVVGAEHSFFRALQRELEEAGADVTWYEGLLVAHGAKPGGWLLSAHIDRHGLMCTGPNEFQYAAFVAGNRSDLLGNSVSEQMMRKVALRFQGRPVIAYEPWSGAYRGTGRIENSYICENRGNLVFELSGLSHVVAGTPIAFQDRMRLQQGTLVGQLDNVLCAAMLVYLFQAGYQGTAFFTAEEESGKSWRYLLEWFRRFGGTTNQLIVLDTSPYPDRTHAERQQVVLRRRDANAVFDEETCQRLQAACHRLDIAFSFKDSYLDQQNQRLAAEGQAPLSLGSTELGRIVVASGGLVQGTTLQIPTIGYHTPNETASLASCQAMLELLLDLTLG